MGFDRTLSIQLTFHLFTCSFCLFLRHRCPRINSSQVPYKRAKRKRTLFYTQSFLTASNTIKSQIMPLQVLEEHGTA